MELYTVNTGLFKLDGGAMFGVVPKVLWSRSNEADENNLCTWAMRSLLVVDGNRVVLIDNGIGDKQDAKFFSHYYLHGDDSLDKSLKNLGVGFHQITDNFLTHLHFDHCGGGIKYGSHGQYEATFPRATYWSNPDHWKWATEPNPREKASFLEENILPMEELGQLQFTDNRFKHSWYTGRSHDCRNQFTLREIDSLPFFDIRCCHCQGDLKLSKIIILKIQFEKAFNAGHFQ
jgi:glyoxylase-like metal-dependent hydrolase (beta-lactamase superfamily II)